MAKMLLLALCGADKDAFSVNNGIVTNNMNAEKRAMLVADFLDNDPFQNIQDFVDRTTVNRFHNMRHFDVPAEFSTIPSTAEMEAEDQLVLSDEAARSDGALQQADAEAEEPATDAQASGNGGEAGGDGSDELMEMEEFLSAHGSVQTSSASSVVGDDDLAHRSIKLGDAVELVAAADAHLRAVRKAFRRAFLASDILEPLPAKDFRGLNELINALWSTDKSAVSPQEQASKVLAAIRSVTALRALVTYNVFAVHDLWWVKHREQDDEATDEKWAELMQVLGAKKGCLWAKHDRLRLSRAAERIRRRDAHYAVPEARAGGMRGEHRQRGAACGGDEGAERRRSLPL